MQPTAWRIAVPLKNLHTRTYFLTRLSHVIVSTGFFPLLTLFWYGPEAFR